ncbi:MAG: hypothetical protein B655_0939 [Methanobacterium sp. Maddingley MBC34]|nr:MAG: hypothetical protein B655_0939 [Methanobacterium sp. Maddingley MBC34]
MGYLICDKCGGYYELQPGEKPEDFSNECECGGELIYSDSLDVIAESNGDIYSGSGDVTGENSEDKNTLNEEEPLISNKGKSIEEYRASFQDKTIIKQMKLATEVQEILETKGHYIIKGNGTVKFIKIIKDGIETDDGRFIRFEDIINIEEIEDVTPKQKISSEKSGVNALISTAYQIFAPRKMTLKIRFNNGEIELKDVKISDANRCASFVKRRLNKVNS